MATLYAPQVRAIQPAFIYNTTGEVEFYFSLSTYNTLDELTAVRYSIVNPNVSSTDGANSMLTGGAEDKTTGLKYYTVNKANITQVANSNEYYFTITLNSSFKEFNCNQFYQVQIWLVGGTEVSEPSQASLIRPINNPNVEWRTSSPAYSLAYLVGELQGGEQLHSCYCTWGDAKDEKSDTVLSVNGTDFMIPLDPLVIRPDKPYTFSLYYTTQYGYQNPIAESLTINYEEPSVPEGQNSVSLNYKENLGAGTLQINVTNLTTNINYVLQRYNLDNEQEGYWQDILKFTSRERTQTLYDNTIESGVHYRYRVTWNNGQSATDYINSQSHSLNFEDIFLSGESGMFAVRYNPNITGFKWVTQESITNTLGGRFPIIRTNGDTKYRQFNLSGTIFSEGLVISNIEETSDFFFSDEDPAFYSTEQDAYMADSNRHISDLERHVRRRIMEFLTDRKVKLFRSYEEGNILVRLTNVSFTPNKQLSRHVYDFSATLTEVDDYTLKNLEKHGLINKQYQRLSAPGANYGYVTSLGNYEGAVTIVPIKE